MRLYLSFNPPGGGGRGIHRHRRVATMTLLWLIVNYSKSEMHKSCKKHSRLFLSAPSLTKTYLFFLLETGHCPPPREGGGVFAPCLPLNNIFSQKLAFLNHDITSNLVLANFFCLRCKTCTNVSKIEKR